MKQIELIKQEIERLTTPENQHSMKRLYDFIESLEKEQHLTKRNKLFDECVKNCDPAIMKEVSDNIDKMLEKEQDVDLEIEIDRFWDSCIKHKNERGGNAILSNKIEIEVLARHFYELGLNARKEE